MSQISQYDISLITASLRVNGFDVSRRHVLLPSGGHAIYWVIVKRK